MNELPSAVRAVVLIEHTYPHIKAGWHPVNSVIPTDCRPNYRNVGGGVTDSMLAELPEALDQCIANVEHGIRKAQQHLDRLKAARAALNTEASKA